MVKANLMDCPAMSTTRLLHKLGDVEEEDVTEYNGGIECVATYKKLRWTPPQQSSAFCLLQDKERKKQQKDIFLQFAAPLMQGQKQARQQAREQAIERVKARLKKLETN